MRGGARRTTSDRLSEPLPARDEYPSESLVTCVRSICGIERCQICARPSPPLSVVETAKKTPDVHEFHTGLQTTPCQGARGEILPVATLTICKLVTPVAYGLGAALMRIFELSGDQIMSIKLDSQSQS